MPIVLPTSKYLGVLIPVICIISFLIKVSALRVEPYFLFARNKIIIGSRHHRSMAYLVICCISTISIFCINTVINIINHD